MPKDDQAPFFPFYPDDFVSDGKVEAMTTEEVGAYMLLLCKAWRERPAATVPNDDRVLARWARLTPDRWAESKAAVLAPWKLLSGELRYQQPRLKKEHEKMLARRRFNHDRATIAANERWGNAPSMLKASPKQTPSKPKAMLDPCLSSSVPVPDSGIKKTPSSAAADKYPPGLLELWRVSPAKARERSSRDECLTWWKKHKCEDMTERIVSSLGRWSGCHDWTRDGGQFIPGLHRWIKAKKWEIEPVMEGPQNGDLYDPVAHAKRALGRIA